MVKDLNVIEQTFDVRYAPKEWKKSYANWDLTDQVNDAKLEILEKNQITTKDYQRIVRNLLNTTKDYHVGIQFYSTEVAMLPFSIAGSKGRYFITAAVQEDWPSFMTIPIHVGDEVLFFNSEPIAAVIQKFKLAEYGNPDSLTDQALAEMEFTARGGLRGNIVPQGPVFLTVRKAGTKNVVTSQMSWEYIPELLTSFFSGGTKVGTTSNLIGESPFLKKDMTTPFYVNQSKINNFAKQLTVNMDYEPRSLGQKNSFLPPLGRIKWKSQTQDSFQAYIYQTKNKKDVGFIRIPTFYLGAYEASDFAEVIAYFADHTDALVIDQMDNGGGSPFFMYTLLSILTDKPLLTTKEREMITSAEIAFAMYMLSEIQQISNQAEATSLIGDSISGYPVDMSLVKNLNDHFNFILDEWDAGRTFTNFKHMYGIDYIQPSKNVRYTKPILVLVNSLDFSCADFFPALLQDNKRATILGTRTAGAGGFIVSHEFPNLFGIASFSYTGSIAERVNHNPIENLGVTPDVWVEFTARDLEFKYSDYIQKVNQVVDSL